MLLYCCLEMNWALHVKKMNVFHMALKGQTRFKGIKECEMEENSFMLLFAILT